MDYTCKCKTRKYKTLIIKHWYNHPKIRHNKIFYDPLPRKGNKNKFKKKKKRNLFQLYNFCTMKDTN